jgi:RNA polymerase sigma factor (sigma-70 family)
LLAKLRYRITSGGETPDALRNRITRDLTYRLAVNVALMDIRARGSDPVSMVDDEHLPDHGQTPFCAAEREELERAIGLLPPRARAVLVLHDIEGWLHEEISHELGMAIGTSKAQLHRARGLLRKILGSATAGDM